MIRKQIVVPPDIDTRIRRLARERGVSQSAVVVEAVRGLPMPDQDIERIISFADTIDGLPETLSEQVDAILYGG
jgi:predicted transcriptional regulator